MSLATMQLRYVELPEGTTGCDFDGGHRLSSPCDVAVDPILQGSRSGNHNPRSEFEGLRADTRLDDSRRAGDMNE
jgi:hypothetical protein